MGRYLRQLQDDVKTAMKAKERERLEVLRMLVASIKSERDDKNLEDLDDEAEMAILLRAVKTRKESVKQAEDAGREDIADKESAEIVLIEAYLPKQMSGDELQQRVAEVAAEVGYASPKDTGKFMQAWMSRYKGQADGRAVQDALKQL